jgi:hypothetical protein
MKGIIAIYGNLYMIIGIIVSILLFKKFATSLANSSSVWTGSYWATGTRKNKVEPSIGDYVGALLWSIILIPVWPIRILFQLWLKTLK